MLALPFGDLEANKIFSSFTLSEHYRKIIEPAGRPFEEYIQIRLKGKDLMDDLCGSNEDEEIIEEDKEEYEWEKEYKANQKSNDIIFSGKDNYYAILGIEELFMNATTDDIRRAYKKLALVYHPDKNKENISLENDNSADDSKMQELTDPESLQNIEMSKLTEEEKTKIEINRKWLKIKEAYETLLDDEKKKKYDSTFQFDDVIPDDDEDYDEKSFFSSFGPVFLKNSIWSKKKPIPKLGDMNTPLERVKQFYRFWLNFQTWRDFSVEGEYNLDEASCRYEKRQMLKENKKMKSSQLKEEKARLIKLANMAYKHDPRIKMEEEKIRAEKEKIRQERILQKQKEKEEEEERIRLLKKQQEENLKRQQEMIIKEKKDTLESVINLAGELGITLSSEDKFQIELNGKTDTCKTVLNEVLAKEDKKDKITVYKNMTKSFFGVKFTDDVEKSNSGNTNSLWKKEEIHALQKAVKKYPPGLRDRWDKIGEIVKTKSTNQIIQMTHYLTTNPSIKIDEDVDLNQILSGKKSEKKVVEKPKVEKVEKVEQDKNTIVIPQTQSKDSATASTASKPEEENWSEEQQKALEGALKKFPSSLPANERWTNIAGEVQGKTKKQCVDRYKYLSSLIKKK
jgi:DnaJ homolog subfamily C member 2